MQWNIYRYKIFLISSPNPCKTFKKKKNVLSVFSYSDIQGKRKQLFIFAEPHWAFVFALDQKWNPFISYESIDLRSHNSTRTQWQGRFLLPLPEPNSDTLPKSAKSTKTISHDWIWQRFICPFFGQKATETLQRYNPAAVQIICSLNRVPVCVGNTSCNAETLATLASKHELASVKIANTS